jgi:hypothetical protein
MIVWNVKLETWRDYFAGVVAPVHVTQYSDEAWRLGCCKGLVFGSAQEVATLLRILRVISVIVTDLDP